MNKPLTEQQAFHFKKRDLLASLKNEWLRRSKVNSRYSLRAYARFIKIEPSLLSKIFREKINISDKMYFRLSERLSSDGIEIAANSHKRLVREKEFKMISDWYHYALLELFLILPYPTCLKACAERLDISHAEVLNAADRLLKLKFLKKDKVGRLILNAGDSSTVGTVTSTEVHRKLQKTYLEKSAEALALCSPEIRDHSGITLAIHKDDLPKAKKLLKDFRQRFNAEMQSRKTYTDVYQLQVSFFPLEKKGLLS